MQHWIFDSESAFLPNWREAMPQAKVIGRDQAGHLGTAEPDILWFRLRAGETVAEVLSWLGLREMPRVVLLCDDPDESLVMETLAAGAVGCCNSHAAPEVLRQVALVVGNGGLWIGQSLLQRVIGTTSRILGQRPPEAKNDSWASRLSERETQVARLIANGASNKEIAGQLSISERTVKAHLTSIFEKLGLRDRLQLSLKINGLTI